MDNENTIITPQDNFEDARKIPIQAVIFSENKAFNTKIKNELNYAGFKDKTLGDLCELKKWQLLNIQYLGNASVDCIIATLNSFGLSINDEDEDYQIISPEDNVEHPEDILLKQVTFGKTPSNDTYARMFIYRWLSGKEIYQYIAESKQEIFYKIGDIKLGQLYNLIQRKNEKDTYGIGEKTIKDIKNTLRSFGFDLPEEVRVPQKLSYGHKIADPRIVPLRIFRFTPDNELNRCVHQILFLAFCEGDKERYQEIMLTDFLSMNKQNLNATLGNEVMKLIEKSLSDHELSFNEYNAELN